MLKMGIVMVVLRTSVFVSSIIAYFLGVGLADMWQSTAFFGPLTFVHVAWFMMVLGMVIQFTTNSRTGLKQHRDFLAYRRSVPQNYSDKELRQEITKMNAGAIRTFIFWLALGILVAVLYFADIFTANEVLMIAITYYFLDALCIVIWCPLQQIFMKSRCCANCRIYGWGYFFDFGLLVLLPGFFTYSLVLLSVLFLVAWEYMYALYPEKFWAGSNSALRCKNCTIKACTIKRKIANRSE